MSLQTLQTIQFGSGLVLASPKAGDLAPNPTPMMVSRAIQNWKCTISGDIKELYGQNQFAVDTAVGKRSIKGSFDYGQYTLEMLNQLFFSDAIEEGAPKYSILEPGEIPGSTAYTVTVANAATFNEDFGVFYAATGAPFEKVDATPAEGQYSVAAGIYTFNVADKGLAVQITYTYLDATTGKTLTINSHQMGYGPVVSLLLSMGYQNNYNQIYLPYCRLGKIDFATKIDDYMLPSTDFQAFAGPDGVVAKIIAPF